MTDSRIQWRVPVADWDGFVERVATLEDRVNDRLIRQHLHQAIDEYADADQFAAVEDMIDQHLQAAGRRPADVAGEKISPDDASRRRGDTTPVNRHIDPSRKEMIERIADENDTNQGRVLANALYEYRHGGRADRVEEKLQRFDGTAENLLSVPGASEDDDDGDDLDIVTRRTLSIVDRLPSGAFEREQLIEAIEDEGLTSDSTIEKYIENVLDHLDYSLHPKPGSTLYIPTEDARDLAEKHGWPHPDAPAIDRKPYNQLSREEKVKGIQAHMLRRYFAEGADVYPVKAVQNDLFNGRPPKRHVNNLCDDVAESPGYERFTSGVAGNEMLRVNPDAVSDEIYDLIDAPTAGDEQEHEHEDEPTDADADTDAAEPDSDPEPNEPDTDQDSITVGSETLDVDDPAEADETMESLIAGTPTR